MNAPLRILHLEDLPSDAELVERELVKGNITFEKRVVDNRPDFILALKDFLPDIILSDHALPSFNSMEALEIVKKETIRPLPFILITGTISEEFAVEVMKSGAYDYILKDRMQRLPVAILNAIEKYKTETEKQKYLDEVIINEALLRDAEKLANVGSWQSDLVTGEIKWSDEAYHIYGYLPKEHKASFELFLSHVHPDDREYVAHTLEDAVQNRNSQKLDLRIIDKNNNLKYIKSELVIQRDEKGTPIFMHGFNQDVTEMKLAEESMKKTEANLRTIIENASTAYILVNNDLNIITFNKLAAEFSQKEFNKTLKEGEYGITYFPEDRQPALKNLFVRALNGNNSRYEINYLQDDGSYTWYDSSIHGIVNNEGKIIGLIMSLVNISERKVMELQKEKITADLIQRNKDLEQFAYIISHNLRAPVANIIGFSEVLEDSSALEPEMKSESIRGISIAVKKLDSVVHDLNYILQIKREVNEQKESVYLSQLVEDIKISIAQHIENDHAEITYDFSQMNEMQTIKSYLYSIFYNLISNSIKYRRPDVAPRIRIISKKQKNRIELLFEDNGLGIDLETKSAQVFGLYKRFHSHVEGKGMGLFMTKTQVESLGGHISVTSEPNKKTIFKIDFDL